MATGDSTSPGPGGVERPVTTVAQLHDEQTGRWQITTQTSIYVLDLDHRQVTRIPGAAGEHGIDKTTGIIYVVRTFTGDRQPRKLARLIRCRRGEPMYLHVTRSREHVALLVSTPVCEIRRLALPEPRP